MMFYAKRNLNIGTAWRDDGHIYPPDCVGSHSRRALDWLSANAKTEGMFNIFTWCGPIGAEPQWDVNNIIWQHSEPYTGHFTKWTALHLIQAT